MSLVRLLTAGKSLVGARDEMSRYRVRKHVALPKFISSKNPFAPGTSRDPLPPPRAEAAPLDVPPANDRPAAPEPKRAALPMPPLGKKSSPAVARPRSARPVRSLLHRLNPLPLIASLKPAPKPVRAALAQAPVQGELSLDRVKVVRNDLSDADLEVVPMKSATADAGGTPDLPVGIKNPSAGPSWEQWTTRLFRASQT